MTDAALADELERLPSFYANDRTQYLGITPDQHSRILAALRSTDNAEQSEGVERTLEVFNGGLVRVPDANNARGYTTHYRPKDAMRAALASQPNETELLRVELSRLPSFYDNDRKQYLGITPDQRARIDVALKAGGGV